MVYKLDASFEVEWEYFFLGEYETAAANAKLDSGGNLIAAGASLAYYSSDYFSDPGHALDGWAFAMSQEGELIWERSIADSVHRNYGSRLLDIVEAEEGYLLVDDLSLVNPDSFPFLNDPDIWLVTLDENGCWNGNCNRYIIITGETDSTTETDETAMTESTTTIYPNPSRGVVHISCEGCTSGQPRSVEVFGMNGKKHTEVQLLASKSTIDLSRLSSGTYLLVHSTAEGRKEVQKIIIK